MKNLGLVFVMGWFISSTAALAEDVSDKAVFQNPVDSDVRAKELVQALEVFQANNIARYTFVHEKNIKILKKPLISKGKLLFDKNKGVYLEYDSPIWTAYLLSDTEIMEKTSKKGIYKRLPLPVNTGVSGLLKAILTADIFVLKKNFRIFYLGNNEGWSLGLKSLSVNVKNPFDEIIVKGGVTLKSITLYEVSDDWSIIRFKEMPIQDELLRPLEEAYFVY